MYVADELIDQVVNAARIPTGKRRREIQRELQTHIEDFINAAREAGRTEHEIEKMVTTNFGDPAQVADGFAWVYRRERAIVRLGVFLLSSLAVTSLMLTAILALQAGIALGFGNPVLKILASRHTTIEALDILFTVTTYTGLVALEELFERHRFFKALAVLALVVGVFETLHLHAPFLIFGAVNGAFFRTIQVFIKSGIARTGLVIAGIALLGFLSFHITSLRFPYALMVCMSWMTMAAAYRQMPNAVARIDAALFHRLQLSRES